MGYHMKESIDTSLRAYLSNVYLRSYDIRFFMGGKNNLQPIHIQGSLDQIDRFTRLGMFIELRGLIDFDFKFREFYYPRDLSMNAFMKNHIKHFLIMDSCCTLKIVLSHVTKFHLERWLIFCFPNTQAFPIIYPCWDSRNFLKIFRLMPLKPY